MARILQGTDSRFIQTLDRKLPEIQIGTSPYLILPCSILSCGISSCSISFMLPSALFCAATGAENTRQNAETMTTCGTTYGSCGNMCALKQHAARSFCSKLKRGMCVYIYIYIHIHMFIYVHTHTYMHKICVYVYICVYIYIYIHKVFAVLPFETKNACPDPCRKLAESKSRVFRGEGYVCTYIYHIVIILIYIYIHI